MRTGNTRQFHHQVQQESGYMNTTASKHKHTVPYTHPIQVAFKLYSRLKQQTLLL
jgi:hypothetical protein